MYNVNSRKRGLPFLFLTFLLVSSTINYCRASFLVQKSKNNTKFHCEHGHLDECLIADDFELEWVMDSYITRILGVAPRQKIPLKRGQTIVCKAGQSPSYFNCKCPAYRPKC